MGEAPRGLGRRHLLAGTVGIGLAAVAAPSRAAATARPFTVPAVQRWMPATGRVDLGERGRPLIVVVAAGASAQVRREASTLAEDLGAALGRRTSVRTRAGGPRAGEIGLRLHAPGPAGPEGYRLDIGRERVQLSASAAPGLFYAGRTLLGMLSGAGTLPAGTVRDRPRFPERGAMIDCGRKYYSPAWLRARIREMSDLKLNRLHLHLSDDQGFRVECRSFPGVHSREHLTHAEIRDLVAYASRRHVQVIPEVDSPGHLTAALRNYPQFQLDSPVAGPARGCLDYTRADARRFITTILEECLELFPGSEFHIGGDEYLPSAEQAAYPQLAEFAVRRHGLGAVPKDGFLGYLNEIARLVESHGKRARVWNDAIGGGVATRLRSEVDVEWWTDVSPLSDVVGIPTPQQVLDAGHRLVNCSYLPTYYVATTRPVPSQPTPRFMYESWSVHRFHGAAYLNPTLATPWLSVPPHAEGLLGATVHLWNDEPHLRTPAEDAAGLLPRLRVMAQQTWGAPHLVGTYAEFSRRAR